MKKLLFALLFLLSTTASASDAPCWVQIKGTTFDANKITYMHPDTWGGSGYVVRFYFSTEYAFKVEVATRKEGLQVISQVVKLAEACRDRN